MKNTNSFRSNYENMSTIGGIVWNSQTNVN